MSRREGPWPLTTRQKSPVDLFVHSTIFVVVDRQARLRGIFQTEGPGVDWAKVRPQILATVKELEGD